MDAGVEVHRLAPEAKVAGRRAMWIVMGIGYLVLLVVYAVVGASLDQIPALFWSLIPLTGAFFAGAAALGNRASAREHAAFGIAIGPDVIRRVSTQFPVMEMIRGQVVRVDELPAGLCVYAEGPPRALFVPRKIEGYPQVREIITRWKAPENRPIRKGRALVTLAGILLGFVAFMTAIMGPDSWGLVIASVVFLGLSAFASWRVARERYLDPKVRRAVLVALGAATLILAFHWALAILKSVPR